MSLNFCFIGAGNLATHLANALFFKGHRIVQVYSRTADSARELAKKVDAEFTNRTDDVTVYADVYFITIKDSAFDEVLPKIAFNNRLVVHCAGSVRMAELESFSGNFGVFYPLQTFSKQRRVDFKNVPVFVEANNHANEQMLLDIAAGISGKVALLDSESRERLHIAAVFACNFVNHFYHLAGNILDSTSVDFDVLRPLILETAQKVQTFEPENVQTGPAVRFDKNIISQHLAKLSDTPEYQKLYETISKSIFDHQKK